MEKSAVHKRPPIYNLLSQALLWDQPLSNLYQITSTFISNTQCMLILLAYQLLYIAKADHDSFAYYVSEFCRIISCINVLNYETYPNAIYIVLAVGFVYSLIFIIPFILSLRNFWINHNFSPKKSAFCIYYGLIHRALGFWILNAFAMSYLNFGLINANGETGIAIACIILIIVNYLLAFYCAIYSHDPFIGPNILACHSATFHVYSFWFKAIAAPIMFLAEDSRSMQWVFVVTSLAGLAVRHVETMRKFPYYDYTAMRLSVFLSTIVVWIGIMNFVALAGANGKALSSGRVLLYIEFPLCSLVLRVMMDSFHKIIFHALQKENKTLKSTSEITRKIFAIMYLLERTRLTAAEETKKEVNEFRYFGALSSEDNQKYLNKVIMLIGGGSCQVDISNNYEAMTHVLRGILEDAIERLNRNRQLQIVRANTSVNHNFPFEISIFNLSELTRLQGGPRLVTIKLYQKLQEKVTRYFEENKETILDLNQFLIHESASANLNNAIQHCIKYYISYWNSYLKPQLKIKDFFLKSQELEKIADNIEMLWKRYSDNRMFAGAFCNVYSCYLSLLRASPFNAHVVYHKYSQIKMENMYKAERERLFTNESLSSPNTFSIYASLTKESPGKIMKLSTNFGELTGWSATDILGHNVNIIMPPFMAYNHNKILLNHLKRLHIGIDSQKMYKTIPTYVMHKNGYMLPCDVYISLHPVVQDFPVYIVFVRLKTGVNEQILLNEDGNIEGFTGKIGHLLNLKNKTKNSYDTICANFTEVQKSLEWLRKEYLKKEIPITNLDAEIGKSMEIDFRLPRQNPLKRNTATYAVDVYPHFFDNRLYFLLSINPTDQGDKKESANGAMTTLFSMQKFETQKEEDQEESYDNLAEVPNERPEIYPLQSPTSSIQSPIQSPTSSTKKFKFEYKRTEEEPTIYVINNVTQKNLLTSQNYYNLNSETNAPGVTSFVVADGGIDALFASNRGLVENKFQENFFEEEEEKQAVKLKDIQIIASSSVGSSSKNIITKFEKALNVMPSNPRIRLLYWSFVILMLVAGIPLVLFQNNVNTVLDQVHGSGEVISNLLFRNTRYTDVFAYTLILWQATIGLTDLYRYNVYGYNLNTIDYNVDVFKTILANVKETNDGIRDFVYKLDPILSEQIYSDLIPVIELQSNGAFVQTREANMFDLSTELVAMGTTFLNSGLAYDETNPYLSFLVNNTMNEPLLAGERELPILLDDNEAKLNGLSTYCLMMIGVTFALAVVIGVFFNSIIMRFTRERSQFIFVFCNINEKNILSHLALLENFQATFNKTSQTHSTASKANFLSSAKGGPKNGNSGKKNADTSGISRSLYMLYLAIFLLLLAICSVYPIMAVIIKSNSKTILKKLNLMAQSNKNFYNVVYYWNVVYAYAMYGLSEYEHVKNMPIKEGVKAAAEDVLGVQDFIINDLLNPENGLSENELLYNTAVGNLCDLYTFEDEVLVKLCPTLGGGAATRGILGLHLYHVVGLQAVESCYTESDHTWEDSKICLAMEEIVNIEVFYPYTYNSYKNIDKLIREEMVKNYEKVNDSIVQFVVIYIVLYALLGTLAGWKIKRRLEEEITDWRKMLRHIPFVIANESKLMKVFLARNREDV